MPKKVRMMVLGNCPHCREAFRLMEGLFAEHPEYREVPLEVIDEAHNPEIANKLDYWYVPTFFVEGEKEHEGVPTKEKVERVFHKALGG